MPSIFDTIFGAVQAKFTGYASVASEILLPWVQSFMLYATPIVEREARSGGKCEIPAIVPPGTKQPCPNPSMIRCSVCRRASCLGHSFVSLDASAICFECVARAARAAGSNYAPPQQPHTKQEEAQPPPQARASREAIRDALAELGLDSLASWEEVEKTYKRLLVEHHPDRKRTEKGKAKAEAKFKKVRVAYDFLKGLRERKAAA